MTERRDEIRRQAQLEAGSKVRTILAVQHQLATMQPRAFAEALPRNGKLLGAVLAELDCWNKVIHQIDRGAPLSDVRLDLELQAAPKTSTPATRAATRVLTRIREIERSAQEEA